ncbi:hypothetical protein ACAW74_13880 [Fibrella sp. WM1]|uniref:hypothetical protein n=1 Tax=Fibrella musci TaxID=3242485 RepID=UPI003522CA2D
MATDNQAWNLESFLDSLVVELDKARETLAVKAINRPLTYTVKDMAMDLHIFPTYDGEEVRFITAQPGQEGASKLSVQLASITDQQVRATSKKPATKDDVSIDIVDMDADTKKTLRKIGVTSVNDLKEIEQKNVDLDKVSPQKKLNYSDLLNRIEKAKRDKLARPRVQSISQQQVDGQPVLVLTGEHLAVNRQFPPVAAINNRLVSVATSTPRELHLTLDRQTLRAGANDVVVTLDPYSIIRLTLNQP